MATNIYEVVLTDIAQKELIDIYDYIYKNLYSKNAANNLMNEIQNRFLLLEHNPYACIEISLKSNNELYRKLVIDNYVALYQINENEKQVVIYRVLFGKSDYLNID